MPNTYHNDYSISAKFNELHQRGEGALVAYLTGNDPTPEAFRTNLAALADGGADILEVGIPFSDPIADGPVIQASSIRALSNGATPFKILDSIHNISSEVKAPIVILTYYNPVLAAGPDHLLEKAQNAGVNGIVIPDLPLEEAKTFREMSAKHSIDSILLAAPNTSKNRLRKIIRHTRGFLYLVSLYGVTGARDLLSPRALETVTRVKKLTDGNIPVSAGFGVSRPEHVSSLLASGADGAIVGSALVKIVAEHLDEPDLTANYLKNAVMDLKRATRNSK